MALVAVYSVLKEVVDPSLADTVRCWMSPLPVYASDFCHHGYLARNPSCFISWWAEVSRPATQSNWMHPRVFSPVSDTVGPTPFVFRLLVRTRGWTVRVDPNVAA